MRKIPIDNHQFPLKIRQLAVASSNFYVFLYFSSYILALSDLLLSSNFVYKTQIPFLFRSYASSFFSTLS